MLQYTLKLTLKTINITSIAKFYKTTVTFRVNDDVCSLPNPRFINNTSASFYNENLFLKIKSLQDLANIDVYGYISTQKEYLGTVNILLNTLQSGSIQNCFYQQGIFKLVYDVCLLANYSPITFSDSQNSDEQFFENSTYQQLQVKKVQNYSQKTTVDDQNPNLLNQTNLKDIFMQSPIKQKSVFSDQLFEDITIRRKYSSISQRLTDFSPNNKFLIPVSCFPIQKSVKCSLKKQFMKQQSQNKCNKLQSSRCRINNVHIPLLTLVYYLLVCFLSFTIGTIVKEYE